MHFPYPGSFVDGGIILPPLRRDICPCNSDLAFAFPALFPASLPFALLFSVPNDLWVLSGIYYSLHKPPLLLFPEFRHGSETEE